MNRFRALFGSANTTEEGRPAATYSSAPPTPVTGAKPWMRSTPSGPRSPPFPGGDGARCSRAAGRAVGARRRPPAAARAPGRAVAVEQDDRGIAGRLVETGGLAERAGVDPRRTSPSSTAAVPSGAVARPRVRWCPPAGRWRSRRARTCPAPIAALNHWVRPTFATSRGRITPACVAPQVTVPSRPAMPIEL